MDHKTGTYESEVVAKEEEISKLVFKLQRRIIMGKKCITSRNDYFPLRFREYKFWKFIQKVWWTPYPLSGLNIICADRIKNLDEFLDWNSDKSFKIK